METCRAPARRWWRAAAAVFRKEMAETLRDRRTLLAAVLLPALTIPLVLLLVPSAVRRQQEALGRQPARVAVTGGIAGSLAALGVREGLLTVVHAADPRAALQRGDLEAWARDDAGGGKGPRTVIVYYDGTRPASHAALQKLATLAGFVAARGTGTREADARQVSRAVAIRPADVATPARAAAAQLEGVLPFFLAMLILLGGQYAALDAGVGERERGSLSALLASPAPRAALVAGKYLAVLVPSLLALAVGLAAALLTVRLGGAAAPAGAGAALSVGVVARLLATGLALGSLLSAGLLAVSLGARTLRAAQQAFAALYLALGLALMLALLTDGWTRWPWVAWVPGLNAVAGMRGSLRDGLGSGALLAILTTSLAATAATLTVAARRLAMEGRPNRRAGDARPRKRESGPA